MADSSSNQAPDVQGYLTGVPPGSIPGQPVPPEQSTVATAPPQETQSAAQAPDTAPGSQGQPEPQYYDYGPVQPEPEYLLGEWIADSRVYRPRTKEYYSSLAVIVLLLSLILFFAGQTLLIFVIWAFLFVSFVLASTKPVPVVIQITTYGIRYQGKLHYWTQLGRFWVRDNRGTPEIHVEAPSSMGKELIILESNEQSPNQVGVDEVVDVLRMYLVNEAPIMTQVDKWIQWLEEKFPLESKQSVRQSVSTGAPATQPPSAPAPVVTSPSSSLSPEAPTTAPPSTPTPSPTPPSSSESTPSSPPTPASSSTPADSPEGMPQTPVSNPPSQEPQRR